MLHQIHQKLVNLRLSQALYVEIFSLLSLFEKLANSEQKIIFLSKCKKSSIFPRTIATMHIPLQKQSTIQFIRLTVLNKAIREAYQIAHSLRQKLRERGLQLKPFTVPRAPPHLSEYDNLFAFAYNYASKARQDTHTKKFCWLQRKHPNSCTNQYHAPTQNHQPSQQEKKENSDDQANINVTDISGQLTNEEKQLLSLGPKFAIIDKPKKTALQASVLRLRYSIEWQAFLDHTSSPVDFIKYPYDKDITIPPTIRDEDSRSRLSILLNELSSIAKSTCRERHRSNLSVNELRTLRSLRNKNLLLLPSDKGGEFCALTRQQYHSAAINHLSGPAYRKIRNVKPLTIEKRINSTWRSVCNDAELPKNIVKQYTATNSRHPSFYCLPKTHKDNPLLKVRPIVSCTRSPDRKVTWLLTKLLSCLVDDVQSHLQSSFQLIEKIKEFSITNRTKSKYPFSLDVVSLYTSIPIPEAINSVTTRLQSRGFNYNGLRSMHITNLLTCILANRHFTYDDQLYEQCNGLAMGSPLSGLLSTLVMDDLERRTLTADLSIDLYHRYVDDIFILTTNAEQAEIIFEKFNNSHSALKFEIEKSKHQNLALLDFQVNFQGNTPTFSFFQKAAKKNVFVHRRSALPSTQKTNIIVNEIRRITERCSVSTEQQKAQQTFAKQLNERGYNTHTIEQAVRKSQRPKRSHNDLTDTTGTRHWFWFPYINDQIDRRIKRTIKKSKFNIGLYRRNQSLRSFLNKSTPSPCPTNCAVDKCQSMNGIYWYQCGCNATYCGSSKRTLHERASEHNTLNPSAISSHRSQCQHESGPASIKIIDKGRDTVDTRLREAIVIMNEKPTLNKKDELIKWIERRP